MLLKSKYQGQSVPVEVSLRLSGMGKQKVPTLESQTQDRPKPSLPIGITGADEVLSEQSSPHSSKRKLEASIDALVDVQLARLAEVPISKLSIYNNVYPHS